MRVIVVLLLLVSVACGQSVKVISDDWTGSGVFITDNVVLTAAHVAEGATNLRVQFADGSEYRVTTSVLIRDRDLAVMYVPTPQVEATVEIARPQAGTSCVAVGAPFGGQLISTHGHIASLVLGVDGYNHGVILMCCQVYPGMSGGPVYNDQSQLVGIVLARWGNIAIAEAIPWGW